MSAIIPHLEQPDEASPVERAYDACASSLNGQYLGHDNPSCPSPDTALGDLHAGLVMLTFAREAVITDFQGRQFVAQAGNKDGGDLGTVYLVLDGPVGPGPAWNPAASPNAQQYALLSWTSKMNAPSWSIPAGALQIGGSCPGAAAGQSIVPYGQRKLVEKYVAMGMGQPSGTEVNLAKSICETCYATGGQYSTGHVQFAQVLRYLWARQAIQHAVLDPDGNASTVFVETMVYAIANANYYLAGGKEPDPDAPVKLTASGKPKKIKPPMPPEPTGRRFFRIHDSGDFFEENYLRQWKMIADRLPDIVFWAPSRIWATAHGNAWVKEINSDQRNLIIRPSAYEINERGPMPERLGLGWAEATTVIHVNQNIGMSRDREEYVASVGGRTEPRKGTDPRYTWDCQAYSTDDKNHTCRAAVAPPGFGGDSGNNKGKGCRACWIAPNEIVNYSLH